jgi:hypothetical protein
MNNELEERINALERHVRRQRRIGAVAGLCVVAAWTRALTTNEVYDVLKAKKIEVIGADGKVVVGLAAWDHGGAVWTYNNDGVAVAAMLAGEEGGGFVAYNNEAETLAGLAAFSSGGKVEVYNPDGQSVAEMMAHEGGGVVKTGNDDGQMAAVLGSLANGQASGVVAFNESGKTVASLGHSQGSGGGSIRTHTDKGKVGTLMISNESLGGRISAFNNAGKEMVSLGGSDNGGLIGVTNKTGEQVVTLGVDVHGNGEVGAWNREGKGRTLTPQ